jgi:hypothetical protein
MSETAIVALVGVLATLVSGLGAAWLTNRSARKRDLDQRIATARSETRSLLVNTIVAAREWSGDVISVSARLAPVPEASAFRVTMDILLSESDLNTHGPALILRLTEAKLSIASGPLSDAIDEMSVVRVRWWADVITPMLEDLEGPRPEFTKRAQISEAYAVRLERAVENLERRARDELAESTAVRGALIRETRNDRT